MTEKKVGTDDIGKRLDVFLSEKEELTRAYAQKLIEDAHVLVLGKVRPKNYKLRENDIISIEYPEPQSCEASAENIPIDIIYEDEDIIVINKARGMVVHPAAGNYSGTLVNALMFHRADALSDIGGVIRPGIVHRIDKDTSGLLVVAKNNDAHLFLSEEIKEHKVRRVYHAIAIGKIENDMTLDFPIGRSTSDRKKMAVTDKNSKPAVTHVEVLENFTSLTYIKCILETGRTHQIRVHLSHIGHPLLGDEVYGSPRLPQNKEYMSGNPGQCLHAAELTLTHPRTGETMHFSSPLPEYFTSVLKKLRNKAVNQ
ncbi:MAG: RluA family pseudouridine synthase [Eubacteriales bacterium]